MKKSPLSVAERQARKNGDGPARAPSRAAASQKGEAPGRTPTQPEGRAAGRFNPWLSALTVTRSLCVIGFGLAAVASFSSYGSHVYRNGALHEPFALLLAAAVGSAALTAWWRFNADKSSQSFLLFVAFAGLAVLYAPDALLNATGQDTTHLIFGPLSRAVFAVAVIAAVAGVQLPALTRLPAWALAAGVVLLYLAADVAIHLNVAADLYQSSPRIFLRQLETISLAANFLALVWANRVWWKTRRPFLIYVIGAVSALTLGSTLFLLSAPWEGRWWVAHMGLFASAVVLNEGVLAETSRRGRLSEVMDLGGLSKLAEGTVDAMRDGLALHDAGGDLVGWNPAAERITGWTRQLAATRLSATLPEGAVELAHGKWVDVRHFTVRQNGYQYQATLFTDVTERKRAEEALRESEERYRSLVEVSPDAVVLTDLEGAVSLCNRRAAALHGYESGEELVGRNFFDLVSGGDRERAMANALRTVREGGVRDVEYRMVRQDGSHFAAELSASVIRDASGRPQMITAVIRDITERKRTDEALQQSEEHFRSLTEDLRRTNALMELLRSVAVAANEATSLKSVIKFTLSRVCAHVGWPAGHAYILAEDAGGGLVSSGIWCRDTAERTRPFRDATEQMRFAPGVGLPGRVLAEGKPAWAKDMTDPGLTRAEEAGNAGYKAAFAFPVLAGEEVVAVLEFFSDRFHEPDESLLEVMAGIGTTLGRVVERRRARDEIDRVFTLSHDMLAIVGFDGDFRRVNQSFGRTLGFNEHELLSIPYLQLIHPEDLNATYNELQRLASGASVKGFEVRTLCKDSSAIWTQWNATPFASDKVIYIHGRDITERKRAEEAIQVASDEVRDLYNAAPCGYHSLDKDGLFVRINDTELEWLGYKRNEVIGRKKINDLLTPAGRKAFRQSLAGFYKRGWMRGLEVEMLRKDGSTFPALLSASAVKDADGRFVMTRSTVFDITERKRAEEELRDSELRAREIVNTAYDAFVAIDQFGNVVDWNPQAEATFGWSRKEVLGRKLTETIVPRRFRRLRKDGLPRFLRTGKVPIFNRRIELAAIDKGGREFPIEMTISPVQVGDDYTFNAFIHDITERKQAETMRARLAAIVESSDDAIIGTSLDGTITNWNKGAVRLYGYSTAEAVGQPITMLAPPGGREEPAVPDNETPRATVNHFEAVRMRKDGSQVEVSLTTSPILEADGVITGASTIARDVTARKRAEALARQTEELARSNADLEQFAYVASHDLQEPLRMVTGYCDLLQRRYKGKLDADADDFITFAVEGAKRMQELVRGLLAYSRVGPHGQTLELVDAKAAFDRAVANLSLAVQESGGTLTHGPLPAVMADPSQLEHLFQNLIGNALKFKGDEPPRVDVHAVRQADMWHFSVKDNGIGIDQRYTEKVFAIFQRLHGRGKYPGTGLGLAICKKIVERHGGRIWFESQAGHGTTFYFTLPTERGVTDNER